MMEFLFRINTPSRKYPPLKSGASSGTGGGMCSDTIVQRNSLCTIHPRIIIIIIMIIIMINA